MGYSVEVVEPGLFAHTVAEEIKSLVENSVAKKGRCIIALSGGKTPGAIYRTLGRPPLDSGIPWDKVTLIMGDERWVPKNDEHSNYNLVHETLLSKLSKEPQSFPVPTDKKTPAEGAKAYSEIIRKLTNADESEIPELDIVLLGIGEDGHTASLFPGDKALKDKKSLFVATHSPSGVKDRVTMTASLIENAQRVLFLVTGGTKADILKKVLEEDVSLEDIPASVFKKAKGQVTWFVDSAAADKLTPES